MSYVPTPEQARELLKQYNEDPFHLHHGEVVSGVMGYYAKEYDPERVDFWRAVGMLHDLDFEKWPEEHCVKSQALMRELDLDPALIRATASHGWGHCVEIQPESTMEKVLFAADELTGLIGAVALVRPSKSVMDMEPKSVKKKFKDLKFAAGCSRDVIQQGADLLGWSLDDLIARTLEAMKSLKETVPEI